MVKKRERDKEFEFLGEYDLDKLLRLKENLDKEIRWANEEKELVEIEYPQRKAYDYLVKRKKVLEQRVSERISDNIHGVLSEQTRNEYKKEIYIVQSLITLTEEEEYKA